MRVSFLVQVDQGRFLDESALACPTAFERSKLAGMSAFQGVLALARDDDASVRIEDVLEAWVQNLCYDAVPRVLDGGSFEILYFSYAGRVRLEPARPEVIVRGDHVEPAAFLIDKLLPALVACGDRFVDWARKEKVGDASYLENLTYIANFRPGAVAALESAGLPVPQR